MGLLISNTGHIIGAAAFTPASIPHVIAYFRADAGAFDAVSGGNLITTSGTGVARWEDQSGNGNHITQATASKRPLWRPTSAPTSKPALEFVSANAQVLARTGGLTGSATSTSATIWALARLDGTNQMRIAAIRHSDGNSLDIRSQTAGQVNVVEEVAYSAVSSTVFAPTNGVWNRLRAWKVSNTLRLVAVNSGVPSSDTSLRTQPGAWSQLFVPVDFAHMNGFLAEIAFFQNPLSAGELADLDAYAMAKYGL